MHGPYLPSSLESGPLDDALRRYPEEPSSETGTCKAGTEDFLTYLSGERPQIFTSFPLRAKAGTLTMPYDAIPFTFK